MATASSQLSFTATSGLLQETLRFDALLAVSAVSDKVVPPAVDLELQAPGWFLPTGESQSQGTGAGSGDLGKLLAEWCLALGADNLVEECQVARSSRDLSLPT